MQFAHRLLHREAAGRRARAIVAVEPARDGVAAEIDDLAPEAAEFLDQGMKHLVQMLRHLFGAAVSAKLGGKGLGQRGEARDIREESRTVNPVGDGLLPHQGSKAITGYVSLKMLQQFAAADCAPRASPDSRTFGRQGSHLGLA